MSETAGRELDWDEEIEYTENSFEPLPAGDYDFTIERFDRGRSKGEGKLPPCKMVTVYFILHGPDGREVTVQDNYPLHSSVEWKLSNLFCGVGLLKPGERLKMNWPALPGLTGRAKVSLKPGYKDSEKKYNRIEKLYPKQPAGFTPGVF
ncbi:MAG: hypothetical protein HFI66_04765 [Lachnospiraceae bacterium]|nr:hypothetical protein [Lachnospiraceae bacterium]